MHSLFPERDSGDQLARIWPASDSEAFWPPRLYSSSEPGAFETEKSRLDFVSYFGPEIDFFLVPELHLVSRAVIRSCYCYSLLPYYFIASWIIHTKLNCPTLSLCDVIRGYRILLMSVESLIINLAFLSICDYLIIKLSFLFAIFFYYIIIPSTPNSE